MRRALLLTLALAVAVAGFASLRSSASTQSFGYEGLPARFHLPAPPSLINGWVARNDQRSERAHAWKIWAALTSPSHSTDQGLVLPVWDTWYSVGEVFNHRSKSLHAGRKHTRPFEVPAQAVHAAKRLGHTPPPVLSFVRYNRAAAEHIWAGKLNLQQTLNQLNAGFNRSRTPAEDRTIAPFPAGSVVLKVVFWLVENPDSGKTPNGLTVFPYWDPHYPKPPGNQTPGEQSWTKCVAVDPTGALVGTTQQVLCNGRTVSAQVVGLDSFYAIRLSTPQDVKYAREVFASAPDQLPPGDPDADLGDYLVLTAMHVTTKEIDSWTWQTYWWTPFPKAAPFGNDRPAAVHGVWRNYAMCTSYSMDLPREANGGPHACFDPYLETDLGPTAFFNVRGEWFPPDPMAGTRSNCMSCHALAAYQSNPKSRAQSTYGRIFNQGYVAPNAKYYAALTRTDFLWSIPDRAQR